MHGYHKYNPMAWMKYLMLMLAWLPGNSACLCTPGEYCDSGTETCSQCSAGTFTSANKHSETYCKNWSPKPSVQHAVIIQDGSRTSDIVYGCESGYEKHEISGGGEWECRKATTTTSTTQSSTKSTSTTTTQLPETTVKIGESSENLETKYIIAIVVSSIVFVLGIMIAVVIYKKCKKKKRNERKKNDEMNKEHIFLIDQPNPVLDPLFTTVVNVLGEEGRKPFIDILDNPNGTFDRNQSSDFEILLRRWARCYPDFIHSQCIVKALNEKGYKLPEGLNETDPSAVRESLFKSGELNLEFKKFCIDLCKELDGADANGLVTNLDIKSDFDNRMHSNSNILDIALPLCLAKWAFQFPYVHNENRDWLALTLVKENLVKIERNDVAENFEEMTKNVKNKMGIFSPIQNGAALQNGAAQEVTVQIHQ